jgi:hypothetical protein
VHADDLGFKDRGPLPSDLMRQARARSQAGEATPPAFHDVAELEHAARLPGLRGELAKARLRLARGPALEGLQTVPALTPGRARGRCGVFGCLRDCDALHGADIAPYGRV